MIIDWLRWINLGMTCYSHGICRRVSISRATIAWLIRPMRRAWSLWKVRDIGQCQGYFCVDFEN